MDNEPFVGCPCEGDGVETGVGVFRSRDDSDTSDLYLDSNSSLSGLLLRLLLADMVSSSVSNTAGAVPAMLFNSDYSF